MQTAREFAVTEAQAGQTLAAALRQWLPGESWSRVRQLVAGRRVEIDGEIVLDPARRLRDGQTVTLLPSAAAPPRQPLNLRHLDEHLVVVEKPAGISTVRPPSERE